jgi:thiol-disulfide isomerase/thioredoxin
MTKNKRIFMKKIIITLIALFTINIYAQVDMNITDTNGTEYTVVAEDNSIKIEGMEGKVVFLEFFGLQCPACKEAMPHLINLQEKYKDKLQVLAVEVQNNEIDPINDYKAKHGINYTTFSNYDIGRLVRYVAEKSGWQGAIPYTVAIDPKGEVLFAQAGVIPEKTLEEYIEKFAEKE